MGVSNSLVLTAEQCDVMINAYREELRAYAWDNQARQKVEQRIAFWIAKRLLL